MTDLFFFLNDSDQLIRDFFRVTVKKTDPVNALNLTKLSQKAWQGFLSIQILSVKGRLLGNQNQFLHAALCKLLRFLKQLLHRYAAVVPTHLRNNTVGTMLITAFRNFQIGIISTCCYHTVSSSLRSLIDILDIIMLLSPKHFIKRIGNRINGCCSKNRIDLRDLHLHFPRITLRQTAGYQKSLQLSVLSSFCHIKDRIDTFFLGIADKAAGIDNNCFRFLFIVCKLISVPGKQAKHNLRVHQILVTAKGYK